MKNDNYINIQGWMINELELCGNELILFALIHGFTQDGKNWYEGSLLYLKKAIRCSKPTVIRILRELRRKELIEKQIGPGGVNKYRSLASKETLLPLVKKLYSTSNETLLPASKETLPYNNSINNKSVCVEKSTHEEELPSVKRWKDKIRRDTENGVATSADDLFEKVCTKIREEKDWWILLKTFSGVDVFPADRIKDSIKKWSLHTWMNRRSTVSNWESIDSSLKYWLLNEKSRQV